jgi:hypothetical protein
VPVSTIGQPLCLVHVITHKGLATRKQKGLLEARVVLDDVNDELGRAPERPQMLRDWLRLDRLERDEGHDGRPLLFQVLQKGPTESDSGTWAEGDQTTRVPDPCSSFSACFEVAQAARHPRFDLQERAKEEINPRFRGLICEKEQEKR